MILLLARLSWAEDDSGASPEEAPPAEPAPTPPPAPPPEAPPADPAPAPPAPSRDDEIFGTGAEPSRDADIFGEGAAEPAAAPPPDDFQGELGERSFEQTSDATIASRLGLADERLTIGGKLYLRGNAWFDQGADFEDTVVDNPNLLDLFADVRPNDRVRGFASGRLAYDFTVVEGSVDEFGVEQEPSSVTLDQLWLKFDVGRKIFFTVGRQRIKWGSGRFWNPTDFMNQQVLDSLAIFDERTGVALVKAHVPFEAAGGNVYLLANFEGAGTTYDEDEDGVVDETLGVGGAARVEWVLGPGEVAVSGAARNTQAYRIGGDLSFAVGPFDLRAEGAVARGGSPVRYSGRFDWDQLSYDLECEGDGFECVEFTSVEAEDVSDEWIPQLVAGAELGIALGDEDALYIGAEYFYNGAGYDDAELLPYLLFQGDYTPFYFGRHYAGAYLYLPAPGQWDDSSFTLSLLANVSDRSGALRFDVQQTVLTWLRLNAYISAYGGEEGGEFRFALDVPESYEAFGAQDIPPPLLAVGAGAQVNF